MSIRTEATIDDLYRVPENGKAELVNGELVLMSPTEGVPGRAAGAIYVSLHDYEKRVGGGYAFPDKISLLARWSCGMLMSCETNSCASIARAILRIQRSTAVVRQPKQSRQCWVGRWHWTRSSIDLGDIQGFNKKPLCRVAQALTIIKGGR